MHESYSKKKKYFFQEIATNQIAYFEKLHYAQLRISST
jgi:hypothetical protein